MSSVPKIDLRRVPLNLSSSRPRTSLHDSFEQRRSSTSNNLQSKSCDMTSDATAASQSRRRSGPTKPKLPSFFTAAKPSQSRGVNSVSQKTNTAAKERPKSAPLSQSLEIRNSTSSSPDFALNRSDSNLFGSSSLSELQASLPLPSPAFAEYLDKSSSLSSSNVTVQNDYAQRQMNLNVTTPPPGGPLVNVQDDLSLSKNRQPSAKQDSNTSRSSKPTVAQAKRRTQRAEPPSPSRKPNKSILRGSPAQADASSSNTSQESKATSSLNGNSGPYISCAGLDPGLDLNTTGPRLCSHLNTTSGPYISRPGLSDSLTRHAIARLGASRGAQPASPPEPEDPSPDASPTSANSSAVAAPVGSRAVSASRATKTKSTASQRKSPSPPNVGTKSPPAGSKRVVSSSASRQFRNPDLAKAAGNGVRTSSRSALAEAKKAVSRQASAPSLATAVARLSDAKHPPSPTESSASSVGSKPTAKGASSRPSSAPSKVASASKLRGSASSSAATPAYARPTATSSRRARKSQPEEMSVGSKSCTSIPSAGKSAAGSSKPSNAGNRRPASGERKKDGAPPRSRASTVESGRPTASFPGPASHDAHVKPSVSRTRSGVAGSQRSERTERTADKPAPAPPAKPRDASRRVQEKGRAEAKISAVGSVKPPEEGPEKGRLAKEKSSQSRGLTTGDAKSQSRVPVDPHKMGSDVMAVADPTSASPVFAVSISISAAAESETMPKGVKFREGEDDIFEITRWFCNLGESSDTGTVGLLEKIKQMKKETAGLTPSEALAFFRNKRADSGRGIPTIVDEIQPAGNGQEEAEDACDQLLRSLRGTGKLIKATHDDLSESLSESVGSRDSESLLLSNITEERESQLGTTMGRGGPHPRMTLHDSAEGEESLNEGEFTDQESSRDFEASFGSGSLGASGMLASGSYQSYDSELQESENLPLTASEGGEEESTAEIEEEEAEEAGKVEEEKERVYVVYPHRMMGYREKYLGHREELEVLERQANAAAS